VSKVRGLAEIVIWVHDMEKSLQFYPIGVQFVARPWRDDVALSGGRLIEEKLGGWQPAPI